MFSVLVLLVQSYNNTTHLLTYIYFCLSLFLLFFLLVAAHNLTTGDADSYVERHHRAMVLGLEFLRANITQKWRSKYSALHTYNTYKCISKCVCVAEVCK